MKGGLCTAIVLISRESYCFNLFELVSCGLRVYLVGPFLDSLWMFLLCVGSVVEMVSGLVAVFLFCFVCVCVCVVLCVLIKELLVCSTGELPVSQGITFEISSTFT